MRFSSLFAASCAAFAALASMAMAENSFTTLGTQAGPIPIPGRSQPANLLVVDGTQNLIDVGDNAAHQLFKAGVLTRQLDRIFISHLHGDHIGGLFAILALSVQTNPENPIQIYGPPGTEEMVTGLLAALKPAMEAGYGSPGAPELGPEDLAVAHDLHGGDRLELPGMTVSTAANTHYSFAPDSPEHDKFQSLSLRFDMADRSILYTGDTGPSDEVAAFAKGADLLVAEVFEVEPTLALVKAQAPNLTPEQLGHLESHFREHHLTPEALAKLASASDTPKLVVTHIGTDHRHLDPTKLAAEIAAGYSGEVTIANDLDRF
ncbi:MBL fold metallo-hydrolase [Paracoccus aestuariivivens]|uniref:MBL fold metallo-hydrolase n=1 Tax=Paracoccus aestuariivivens TaxID=1820333 RepID=A0A6L6JHH5_9RHOB|nr:MBL fold metallo-hydrolase [Paracoccus aestuariivivens]MTH79594.1 MBL fold metallo-hydrolase [Paracoccus aestuariivivens]